LLIALTIFSGAFIVPTIAGLFGFRTSKIRSSAAMIVGGAIALSGKIIALSLDHTIGNMLIIVSFCINATILFIGKSEKMVFNQVKQGDRPVEPVKK
jgi:SSS family solute:Na+ symporter